MRRGNVFKRNAGILMAISSLPSPYGIGTLGKEAYEFIDFVRDTNHKYWQVLPVEALSILQRHVLPQIFHSRGLCQIHAQKKARNSFP